MSGFPRLATAAAVLVAAAWYVACGGGTTEPPPRPPEPANRGPVAVGTIPAQAVTVGETTTVDLSAYFRDPDGDALTFSGESSDSRVASVSVTGSTASVTGVGAGTATISVTARDPAGLSVRQSFEVAVAAPVPTTIVVTPDAASLTAIGQTVALVAEVRDQAGRALPGVDVSWSSGDTSVVTVDSTGIVTAAGRGSTTVTAAAGEAAGGATVSVMQEVASVIVTPSLATLAVGDTLRLTAFALDANEHLVPGAEFDWTSSASSVASVDDSGLVRGVGPGTATITAASAEAEATSEITVPNPDRAALVALYESTDGPNWLVNDNWLTDAPIGEWSGVLVDDEDRVVRLSLYRNGLSGPLPPEIGNLTRLQAFFLSNNRITGSIPPEFAKLPELFWINLKENRLTGTIPPELGSMPRLVQLQIWGNELSGPIPPELGYAPRLRVLYLHYNNFTGSIPRSFLRLSPILFRIAGNAGLCMPGTSEFVAWFERIDRRNGSFCSEPDIAVLESLYEGTGGDDWTRSDGWFDGILLSEWYGVTPDSIGRVQGLDLSGNGLAGRLPPRLADLSGLTDLRIGGNPLTGPLPLSLRQLPLRTLHYADTDLCVPGATSFRAWLAAIESHDGTGVECAPATDRSILEAFHAATSGADWDRDDNWLTDAPLDQWHGVETDADGRVVSLALAGNRLRGPLPPELGGLSRLRRLDLASNPLTGPIPPELGNLSRLTEVRLVQTGLSGPIPPELANLTALEELSLDVEAPAGPIPPELGNLRNLRRLVLTGPGVTGSIPPELGNLANLDLLVLGYGALTGRIPGELGRLSNLSYLIIRNSPLTGPIPPEVGNLTGLYTLELDRNRLTGEIPPELGRLANLTRLSLNHNALAGAIPSELGDLGRLRLLRLQANALSGPLPPQLGRLAALTELNVDDNRLTGSIPPQLGDLSDLVYLYLRDNALTGRIPPELGYLSRLRELYLDRNRLTGPIPPEFSGLTSLETLGLSGNPELAGALPTSLTALGRLDIILAAGTGLCTPDDAGFLTWLDGVRHRVPPCPDVAGSAAYLTQAIQSRDFPVPLVAGEEALLRVFAITSESTEEPLPPVRATFYRGDAEVYAVDIPGKAGPIPVGVDEGSRETSSDARIPGDVVQPGLEMVVEIDPGGTLPSQLGVTRRLPETGRTAIEVAALPALDLTLVPFIWTSRQDSGIVDLIDDMAADPAGHEQLWHINTILPVGELRVTAHEPVLSSTNSGFALLGQTAAIRAMENGSGYYMGMMSEPITQPLGVAFRPGWTSFSAPRPTTMAHELGHNMSLQHAPCGNASNPDPLFPHTGGLTGGWGFDFTGDGELTPPTWSDLMGYCGPRWISDYHFTKALRRRQATETAAAGSRAAAASVGDPTAGSLLLWGGVDPEGTPYLEPVFVVDAAPSLPATGGEYSVSGRDAGGRELFSLSFDMPLVADAGGGSSFVFILPPRAAGAGELASVTLSGPAGSATLDRDSDRPMAILRDPRTGRVRGILGGSTAAPGPPDLAAALAAEHGLDVLLSRGIPEAEAWRR
ncbi:Ig-like domain-containing protein [Candidatus Palauibacter sp.]|uniref:Ig-like domain-containing protein n=1 Tax=Candidatus Palauibacter sp. TaxID=3101350 RepID=UPI003B02E9C2